MGYTNCKCTGNKKSYWSREFDMQGNDFAAEEIPGVCGCKHDGAWWCMKTRRLDYLHQSLDGGLGDARVERVPSGSKIECRKHAKKPEKMDWCVPLKSLNAKFNGQIGEDAGISIKLATPKQKRQDSARLRGNTSRESVTLIYHVISASTHLTWYTLRSTWEVCTPFTPTTPSIGGSIIASEKVEFILDGWSLRRS